MVTEGGASEDGGAREAVASLAPVLAPDEAGREKETHREHQRCERELCHKQHDHAEQNSESGSTAPAAPDQ